MLFSCSVHFVGTLTKYLRGFGLWMLSCRLHIKTRCLRNPGRVTWTVWPFSQLDVVCSCQSLSGWHTKPLNRLLITEGSVCVRDVNETRSSEAETETITLETQLRNFITETETIKNWSRDVLRPRYYSRETETGVETWTSLVCM